MKSRKLITIAAMALVTAGCSHNPFALTIGKRASAGNAEYGELSYLNGLAILDVSRENSSWSIEVDDEDGLRWDAQTQTLKGVKRIERHIGPQVTGYLRDIADKVDADALKVILDYIQHAQSQEVSNGTQRSTQQD